MGYFPEQFKNFHLDSSQTMFPCSLWKSQSKVSQSLKVFSTAKTSHSSKSVMKYLGFQSGFHSFTTCRPAFMFSLFSLATTNEATMEYPTYVFTQRKKRNVIFGGVVSGIKQTDFISIFHEKILLPARLMNKQQWLGCRCRSRVYSIQFFSLPCKPWPQIKVTIRVGSLPLFYHVLNIFLIFRGKLIKSKGPVHMVSYVFVCRIVSSVQLWNYGILCLNVLLDKETQVSFHLVNTSDTIMYQAMGFRDNSFI